MEDFTRPDPDMSKAHPLTQTRYRLLEQYLNGVGYHMRTGEVFRGDRRQRWLWGAGRTAEQCIARGLDPMLARPQEPIVTNAWTSSVSPHGWLELGHPAAAALDVIPCGADGRPWTRDDPWDEFVVCIAAIGPRYGLVHFHSPGKAVWDRPHLQLVEWSDRAHRLLLPEPRAA